MIFNHVTGNLYKLTRESHEIEEYSQNPLFVNQNTGIPVFKPYFYMHRPFTEYAVCPDCGQTQAIECWETKRYQITRTHCRCPMQLTVNPILDFDFEFEPLTLEPITDHDYEHY